MLFISVFYMDEDLNKSEAEVCNCCWDCCGSVRMYNTGAQPLLLKAFYVAEVSDALGAVAAENVRNIVL